MDIHVNLWRTLAAVCVLLSVTTPVLAADNEERVGVPNIGKSTAIESIKSEVSKQALVSVVLDENALSQSQESASSALHSPHLGARPTLSASTMQEQRAVSQLIAHPESGQGMRVIHISDEKLLSDVKNQSSQFLYRELSTEAGAAEAQAVGREKQVERIRQLMVKGK